jgi:transcription antitermination factor NusG
MSRDWYIIYTSNSREKKVIAALHQKNIINYFPFNNISSANAVNPQTIKKSLFKSYVFVYISSAEIEFVKQIPGVINFLYWLNQPAIIKKEEIEAIQLITSNYNNINVEKSAVNMQNDVSIVEDTLFNSKGISDAKKTKTLTIVLPTIGYTMKAEREPIQPLVLDEEMHDSSYNSKKINLLLQ